MLGKVYKSTGSWYVVKTAEGKTWNARLKGLFKIDGITSTNPLAVGDTIDLEPENEDESTAIITARRGTPPSGTSGSSSTTSTRAAAGS